MEVNHNDPDDEILINFQSEGVSKANISFDTSDDDVDYNKTSDERIKRNIRDADDLLSLVNSIEVKKYRKIGASRDNIGCIGQQVKTVFPQAVSIFKSESYDDFHYIDYSNFVGILMGAVQELSAKVTALENA